MKGIVKFLMLFLWVTSVSQETNIVILDSEEVANLRQTLRMDNSVKKMCDSIVAEANTFINHVPRPLETVRYEGLLDNNPDRLNTMKSFVDIDIVTTFIYAGYVSNKPDFGKKAKEIIVAWATT